MFTKPKWLVLVAMSIVVAACLVLLVADLDIDGRIDPTADLDEAAKDRLASESAIRQIAAESDAIDTHADGKPADAVDVGTQDVVASAPPGFQPAPAVEGDPTPPEGYSFSTYHEVTRAPLTAGDRESLRKAAPVPEWMDLGVDALADQAAAEGRDSTFGWIKLAEGAGLADLAAVLAAQGGEAIGQAGDLVRARLPAEKSRLDAIASASPVAGIGTVAPNRKITDTLAERALANASEEVPVWITLMDDDPDGAWRRELQSLGAVVGRFDPAVRSYAATIPLSSLGPISRADFVLGVESIGRLHKTLATATSAMGADWARIHDDATGLFTGTGGASVPVGVMDTGLNIAHPDIASNRRSICGANFTPGFDPREEDQDLWFDFNGHGTAVTGVAVGSGTANPVHAGMAPLVQDIRFAKALSSIGSASTLAWGRALDWLATPTACGDDIPRKPLVFNSSLGVGSDIWEARSYVERKIDASVWTARQLFVTSAGNTFPGDPAFSSMAGAKNALSVGATQTIGDIAYFSSPGPTEDGRLTPNVVGTGVAVMSAQGRGSTSGYGPNSGTSFSSPAVVGIAALVMDAVPELKEEPAALRARLMASAIKPDGWFGRSAKFALDNTRGPGSLQNLYGLGKVSGRTAILNRDTEDGWFGGSTAFDVDPDSYVSHDIMVPEGASRLEIVLTWDEPPAETITNSVLHDLDLWVDWKASCRSVANCGEFHSLSAVDNVEWVIVPNPPPGLYRVKVTPGRVHGAPPRAGLAWTVIRGDSTPRLSVSANVQRVDVEPDKPFEVEVTLSSDAYVAAGANLRVDCRAEMGSNACDDLTYDGKKSSAVREDGVERNLEGDGGQIHVGEIGPDEEQVVTLSFPGQSAGSFQLYLAASGWNAESGATSVAVVVGDPDAEAPTPIERPANDDFESAIVLASDGGETTFDLVAATPGPADPRFLLLTNPERHRSLWYLWTAPDHGLARFTVVNASPDDYADGVVAEVFHDGPLAALEPVGTAKLGGGAAFFAERGKTYRIRLLITPDRLFITEEDEEGNPTARQADTPELTLKWGPATTPENDHYADAAMVEGEIGTVTGNNQTATTEPGEFMGDGSGYNPTFLGAWGSSVWYRWTAPSTGDRVFSVNRRGLLVSVFTGDGVDEARLVSGAPGTEFPDNAVFPATEGAEYRVGVASATGYLAGTEFKLSWKPGMREKPGNDDFSAAVAVEGNMTEAGLDLNARTVEHGEPVESGVRTAWYTWQPEAAGRHTWNVAKTGGFAQPLGDATLQISVFKGTELAALEPVAMDAGDDTDMRMAFDAEEDASYAFALGLPRSAAQVSLLPGEVVMQWGPTPANDDLANAIHLTGMSGSVTGSNEFATNETGEFTGALGDSSLWWTIEPEQGGWLRFAAKGHDGLKLAVYRMGDHGLELVASSRSLLEGETTLSFNAEAGVRYVIRLGSYLYDAEGFAGGRERGEFELSWGPAGPPARLAFVAAIVNGDLDDDGTAIELEGLGAQAFNTDGTELYVASELGIVVFARDAKSGELTFVETLADHPVEDPGTQLLWDEAGSALLVASCDGWAKFTPVEGGGIESAGEVAGGPCPTRPLLIAGSFVYDVSDFMIEAFRFNDDHSALESAEQVMIDFVSTAALTANGSHLYAVAGFSLMAFERDAENGSLSLVSTLAEGSPVGEGETVVEGIARAQGLAVHASHLFVSSGRAGAETAVFDLADPGNPAFVTKVGQIVPFISFFGSCANTLARHDVAAVDAACSPSNYAYTVQAGTGSAFPSDLISMSGGSADGFGKPLPDNDVVYSFIESPDGRHLYIAGLYETFQFFPTFEFIEESQMLVFERRTGN